MAKINYAPPLTRKQIKEPHYISVLPSEMWVARRSYRRMRQLKMHPMLARHTIYNLVNAGRTARSCFEIQAEKEPVNIF